MGNFISKLRKKNAKVEILTPEPLLDDLPISHEPPTSQAITHRVDDTTSSGANLMNQYQSQWADEAAAQTTSKDDGS